MESVDEPNQQQQPKVKMPTSIRHDSGICTDLTRLSLNTSSSCTRSYNQRLQTAEPITTNIRHTTMVTANSNIPPSSTQSTQGTAEWEAIFNEKCKILFEPDEDGDVQLHLAIATSNYEVADTLIRLAPDAECLDVQNKDSGYSPLHLAVLRNQPSIVRALIVYGAKHDSRDKDGNTPLHLAAIHGYTECGDALLKPVSVHEMSVRGASGAPPSPAIDVVDICNYYGEQCVHLAAMAGHCNFLQFLCWSNADMNAQEGRGGRTALHFAVGSRNTHATRCLVERRPEGCGVRLDILDWYGRSPVHLAAVNGSGPDLVNYLSHQLANRASSTPTKPQHVLSVSDDDDYDEIDSDNEDAVALEMHSTSLLLGSSA